MRKEKLMQINKIQGYEDIRDYYWISNADTDKVVNRNTGKQMKIGLDDKGYKIVSLMTKDGGKKTCRIHVLKAKAFLFGPNPLGANVVRHLNDVKTDNRLINLAFGTFSDNIQDSIRNGRYNYKASARGRARGRAKGGAKNGAKNGRRTSKPVKCLETGIIYPSASEASRQTKIHLSHISECCNGKYKTSGGYHWEFVDKK